MKALLIFLQHRRSLDIVIVFVSCLGVVVTSGNERLWWSFATLLSIALYYADVHRMILKIAHQKIARLDK